MLFKIHWISVLSWLEFIKNDVRVFQIINWLKMIDEGKKRVDKTCETRRMKEKPRIFGPTGFGLKDLFVKTTREDIMSLLTTSAISLEKLATVIFLEKLRTTDHPLLGSFIGYWNLISSAESLIIVELSIALSINWTIPFGCGNANGQSAEHVKVPRPFKLQRNESGIFFDSGLHVALIFFGSFPPGIVGLRNMPSAHPIKQLEPL